MVVLRLDGGIGGLPTGRLRRPTARCAFGVAGASGRAGRPDRICCGSSAALRPDDGRPGPAADVGTSPDTGGPLRSRCRRRASGRVGRRIAGAAARWPRGVRTTGGRGRLPTWARLRRPRPAAPPVSPARPDGLVVWIAGAAALWPRCVRTTGGRGRLPTWARLRRLAARCASGVAGARPDGLVFRMVLLRLVGRAASGRREAGADCRRGHVSGDRRPAAPPVSPARARTGWSSGSWLLRLVGRAASG